MNAAFGNNNFVLGHGRGLDNAGKTTVTKKFNGEDIGDIAPTPVSYTHLTLPTTPYV